MKYTPENVERKNGRICKNREIQVKDAANNLKFLHFTCTFMQARV